MPKPVRQVLVCLNQRPPGSRKGCCLDKDAEPLYNALKDRVRDMGLRETVMVNRTGCLKHCSRGVTVAVQPDNVWYTAVTLADVDDICESHLRCGNPVERLFMPDIPWE